MRPKDIPGFRDAILATHGVDSLWRDTVPVKEVFHGQTAWEGDVEIFELIDHPKAKRCYAWRYLDGKTWRYTAVLEIPPVDSAETAVKVAIAASAKVQRHPRAT